MRKIIRFLLVLLFLACMLFANFYAVRAMFCYGENLYFYGKLLVAYNIAGTEGLKIELEKISVDDNSPYTTKMSKDFAIKLKGLKNPAAFLSDQVSQNKKMIKFFRGLRSAAIVLMILIFAWQLVVKYAGRSLYRRRS